jgi:hypothetical protein
MASEYEPLFMGGATHKAHSFVGWRFDYIEPRQPHMQEAENTPAFVKPNSEARYRPLTSSTTAVARFASKPMSGRRAGVRSQRLIDCMLSGGRNDFAALAKRIDTNIVSFDQFLDNPGLATGSAGNKDLKVGFGFATLDSSSAGRLRRLGQDGKCQAREIVRHLSARSNQDRSWPWYSVNFQEIS